MATIVEWKASSIAIDEEVVIPHDDSSSEDDEEESDAVPIIPEEEDDNDTVFNLTILEQMSASQRMRTHDSHKQLFDLVKQTVATEEDIDRNHASLRVCEGQKGLQCIHCNNKLFYSGNVAVMKASKQPYRKVNDAFSCIKQHIFNCKKVPMGKKDWFHKNTDKNGAKANAYNKQLPLNNMTRLSVEEYADLLGLQKFTPLILDFNQMCKDAEMKLSDAGVLPTAKDHRPLHEYLILEEAQALCKLIQGLQSRAEMSALDPRKKRCGKKWFVTLFEECGKGSVQEFYPRFNALTHKGITDRGCMYMKKPIVHLFKWVQHACAECNEPKTDKRYGHGGHDGNHALDDYKKSNQKTTKRFGMSTAHMRNVPSMTTEALVNFETCEFCHNRTSNMTDKSIKALKEARKRCSRPYLANTQAIWSWIQIPVNPSSWH